LRIYADVVCHAGWVTHRSQQNRRDSGEAGGDDGNGLGRSALVGGSIELPDESRMRVAATGFALLADPSRLRVLWVLAHGDADVTTLAQMTGARPPAVSQHLAKLRLAGLVQATRDGRRQIYSVGGGHVRRLVLEALEQAEHQVTGLPDHD
jgi:DNA-binding transcriptional ArsR family regulator